VVRHCREAQRLCQPCGTAAKLDEPSRQSAAIRLAGALVPSELGVRRAACSTLAAPEHWREWVYIESGYPWLLWTGGVPLVAAFLFFLWISLQDLRRVIHGRSDAVR